MLNIVSLLIGFAALSFAVPAFLPFLGALNWLIIPLALVGLGFGVVSAQNAGRNLNAAVIVVGVVRLMLGGGIF